MNSKFLSEILVLSHSDDGRICGFALLRPNLLRFHSANFTYPPTDLCYVVHIMPEEPCSDPPALKSSNLSSAKFTNSIVIFFIKTIVFACGCKVVIGYMAGQCLELWYLVQYCFSNINYLVNRLGEGIRHNTHQPTFHLHNPPSFFLP